jgi:hypothetical protein
MNKIFELKKYKKDDLTSALIYVIGYPIVVYLATEFVFPLFSNVVDSSRLEGPITIFLGFGCFILFILGSYLWFMFAYQIGNFLWSTYIKNNTEDE